MPCPGRPIKNANLLMWVDGFEIELLPFITFWCLDFMFGKIASWQVHLFGYDFNGCKNYADNYFN